MLVLLQNICLGSLSSYTYMQAKCDQCFQPAMGVRACQDLHPLHLSAKGFGEKTVAQKSQATHSFFLGSCLRLQLIKQEDKTWLGATDEDNMVPILWFFTWKKTQNVVSFLLTIHRVVAKEHCLSSLLGVRNLLGGTGTRKISKCDPALPWLSLSEAWMDISVTPAPRSQKAARRHKKRGLNAMCCWTMS